MKAAPRPQKFAAIHAIYICMAQKTSGRWVVYEFRDGEFIHLSKLFTSKEQAEKAREKMKERPQFNFIGVGFVRVVG